MVQVNSTRRTWWTFNRLSLSDIVVQSISVARLLRKRKVPDSNPNVGNFFNFVFLACFVFLAARASPCKWNQSWHTLSQYHVLDERPIEKIWRHFHVVFSEPVLNCRPSRKISNIADLPPEDLQHWRVLYQICGFFFGPIWEQDGRPGLWLAKIFSTSPLKLQNGTERH